MPRIAFFHDIGALYTPNSEAATLVQVSPDDFERAARLREEA